MVPLYRILFDEYSCCHWFIHVTGQGYHFFSVQFAASSNMTTNDVHCIALGYFAREASQSLAIILRAVLEAHG